MINVAGLEAAARIMCITRSRHCTYCSATQQPDGSTTCSCGRWANHLFDTKAIIDAYRKVPKEKSKKL